MVTIISPLHPLFVFIYILLLVAQMAQGQAVEKTTDGKLMTVDKYLDASAKKEQEGDYKEASRFMNGAATWHWERKEYNKAIEYFERSIRLNERINNQQGIIGIKNNLGMIYADIQQYDKALEYFEVVLQARRMEGEKLSIVASLVNISVITNNLKKYEKSIKYLEEAASMSVQIGDAEQLRAAYGSLAETYEKMGNTAKMLYYFDLYKTFHEKSQNDKLQKITASTEEIRLRAALLESENKLKSMELAKKNTTIEEQEGILQQFSVEKQELLRNASRNKLLLELFQKEKLLANMKVKATEDKLHQEQMEEQYQLYIFLFALITAIVIVMVLVFKNRQIKKYNQLLELNQEEITRKSEELIATSSQLDTQNRQLSASNEVKDKILSIIAHDVRSPLGMIIGFLDLLNSGDLSAEEVEVLSQQLHQATDNTLQMVETLLLWGRSQMKGIVSKPQPIDLPQLVQKKVELLGSAAQLKNIQLIQSIPPQVWVQIDKMQIDIVLHNLLSNAIKFTETGGTIKVTGQRKGSWYALSISDNGVGMNKEQLDKLFHITHHTSTRGTQGEKGTGLGLLLCKEFVENHGSGLRVESEQGKGTTFSFMLPLAPTPTE